MKLTGMQKGIRRGCVMVVRATCKEYSHVTEPAQLRIYSWIWVGGGVEWALRQVSENPDLPVFLFFLLSWSTRQAKLWSYVTQIPSKQFWQVSEKTILSWFYLFVFNFTYLENSFFSFVAFWGVLNFRTSFAMQTKKRPSCCQRTGDLWSRPHGRVCARYIYTYRKARLNCIT